MPSRPCSLGIRYDLLVANQLSTQTWTLEVLSKLLRVFFLAAEANGSLFRNLKSELPEPFLKHPARGVRTWSLGGAFENFCRVWMGRPGVQGQCLF